MTFYEPQADARLDPAAIVSGCVESGARGVLLDGASVPEGFYDLSTRVAGELLHRLGVYGLRLATVVPDPSVHPSSFRAFAAEANRGRSHRFVATRAEAVEWLEAAES